MAGELDEVVLDPRGTKNGMPLTVVETVYVSMCWGSDDRPVMTSPKEMVLVGTPLLIISPCGWVKFGMLVTFGGERWIYI